MTISPSQTWGEEKEMIDFKNSAPLRHSLRIRPTRVFLATPITPLLISPTQFDPVAAESIVSITESLRLGAGFEVFCAIEREKFGKELMDAKTCTPIDLDGMREADVVVAFPDSSYGVHVELGWASALGKPIMLLMHKRVFYRSPLVEGLPTVTKAETIWYESDHVLPSKLTWKKDIEAKVIDFINRNSANRRAQDE